MGATWLEKWLTGVMCLKRLAKAPATLVLAGFTACAPYPAYMASPSWAEPIPPPPQTQVFFYPAQGQDERQRERDRYDCYLWATRQTGFDPSAPQLAPHQSLRVIPQPPPGQDTVLGAATGALLGAVVTPHRRTAEGMIIGAIAGAVIGAASDAGRQEQTARLQQHYDRQAPSADARIEEQARDYQRAMAACLEGRGYTVSE